MINGNSKYIASNENFIFYGAPTATELEPHLLDELADWEKQLKPLKQEISEILGGLDHE